MIPFDIRLLYPAFLLADRNGYAMAKALEAGLRYFLERCRMGVDMVQNVAAMPEWRLDEMAWETNCLYDYGAGIDSKRHWIKQAQLMDQQLGTAEAIKQYLQGHFANVKVEEWWQYGGEPCHFRVACYGEVTTENEEWARRAIARAQNVRSVLDGMTIYKENGIVLEDQTVKAVAMPVMMCSNELLCGEE